MAISVKDIKEKDFTAQKHGYSIEEVDDFLDEIADQVSELIKENFALKEQLKAAPAPVVEEKKPEFDDSGYFESLQKNMREALISANRIAEETRKAAEAEAAAKVAEAQAKAEEITTEAKAEVEACKAEAQVLRENAANYRAAFRAMVEQQLEALKASEETLA